MFGGETGEGMDTGMPVDEARLQHDARFQHESIRVALVTPPYFEVPPAAYGGIEAVVADLADALVDNGHSVVLIGAGENKTKARFVRVWDRIMPERLGEPYPELMNASLTRNAIRDLVGHIDHSHSGPLNAETYARWGLPTVVTMHGPSDDPDFRSYYGSFGDSIHMVAISDRQRQLAPELNWIGTVHNALNVEQWPFHQNKNGYGLFLGRFSPDKGAHLALDAAHAVGMPLVLAGKIQEDLEKRYVEEQIKPRLGPDDVMFGVADSREKRILLSNARCLLFPVQWEEPFGMVMIEAMACGTPVVALRGGSVPEIVVDGVTGIICDTPAQLPAAIERVARFEPSACRAHVASRFSATALARGYAEAYRAAIATMRRTTLRRANTKLRANAPFTNGSVNGGSITSTSLKRSSGELTRPSGELKRPANEDLTAPDAP
jgi:glycosyltransferase involved in cell wall biosynthesis